MKGSRSLPLLFEIFISSFLLTVGSCYEYYMDYYITEDEVLPQTTTSSWNARPATTTWKIQQPTTPQRQFVPPAPPPQPSCTPGVCFELGNYPGGNGGRGRRPNVATKEECQQLCRNDPNCCHWSHYGPNRNPVNPSLAIFTKYCSR